MMKLSKCQVYVFLANDGKYFFQVKVNEKEVYSNKFDIVNVEVN